MRKVQGEDRDQHQQAAKLGEQKKLRRGVHAALVSPDGDEKIHRDQHQFPGEVEKKQIDREEDADDSSENPQQIEVEKSDAPRNFGPGRQHGYDTQKQSQQHEQKAEAVHRQVELNAKLGNPAPVHLLEPLVCAV